MNELHNQYTPVKIAKVLQNKKKEKTFTTIHECKVSSQASTQALHSYNQHRAVTACIQCQIMKGFHVMSNDDDYDWWDCYDGG